jgi:hypothetical protein
MFRRKEESKTKRRWYMDNRQDLAFRLKWEWISGEEFERMRKERRFKDFGGMMVKWKGKKGEWMSSIVYGVRMDAVLDGVKREIAKLLDKVEAEDVEVRWDIFYWVFEDIELWRHTVEINGEENVLYQLWHRERG